MWRKPLSALEKREHAQSLSYHLHSLSYNIQLQMVLKLFTWRLESNDNDYRVSREQGKFPKGLV